MLVWDEIGYTGRNYSEAILGEAVNRSGYLVRKLGSFKGNNRNAVDFVVL